MKNHKNLSKTPKTQKPKTTGTFLGFLPSLFTIPIHVCCTVLRCSQSDLGTYALIYPYQ